MKIEFTRHATIEKAKRNAPHFAHNPVIVALPGGGFDSFPLGHPLPSGAEKVAFTAQRASGKKYFRTIDDEFESPTPRR